MARVPNRVFGYGLMLRPGQPLRLEPREALPDDLSILGQSITLDDALMAFGPTKEELLEALERNEKRTELAVPALRGGAGVHGYALVFRSRRGESPEGDPNGFPDPSEFALEPAEAAVGDLKIVGRAITLDDAIRAFGMSKGAVLAAHERALGRKHAGT